VRKDASEMNQQKAIKDFVSYAISNGQDAAEGLFYAKLPPSLRQQDESLLGQLTAGGHALD
jgi:hypothetical protein